MQINPDDIDAVFRLRHETKVATDVSRALEVLDELRARAGDTVAIAFNRALCLLEFGDVSAAHAEFRGLIKDAGAPVRLGAFIVDGVELFLKTTADPVPAELVPAILEIARFFNVDQRDRFLSFLLARDAERTTFDLFWSVLDASQLPAFGPTPAESTARLFFSRSSSHDAEDRFKSALDSDPRLASLRGSDGGTLIELLHADEQEPSRWLATLRELADRKVFNNRDAMDLSLIAVSMIDDETAQSVIETIASQSNQNWGAMRVLGIIAERAGDRAAALRAYDRATRTELEVRCVDIPPALAGVRPRISGIALSFNDAPLVSHFCHMISTHCDELVVNDGGSTDDTVACFKQFSAETGFPVHVIEDLQHGNRQRTIFDKEGYRERNLGGVLAFDADRRRTTTLVQAEGDYALMLDLDDYMPPFPNLKTLVEASPYVDHFAGARLEVIGSGHYTALHLGPTQACPTLFRRHPKHVYGGVDGGDEYLSRLDLGIAKWAMMAPHVFVTDCYNYWHLKHVLDGRMLPRVRRFMGPSYRIKQRWDRPLSLALPSQVRI